MLHRLLSWNLRNRNRGSDWWRIMLAIDESGMGWRRRQLALQLVRLIYDWPGIFKLGRR